MRFRSNRLRGFSACLLLACLVSLPAGAEEAAPATPVSPTGPLVVKIHADWCGTCVKLTSVWEELQAGYGDSARFVVLDVTDRSATVASAIEAERLGISEFFDANKGRTGTIGILDPATGEAVEIFKGETDAEVYESPLAALLKAS
jgi:thiol-disulfide isomerase/thioredoxin